MTIYQYFSESDSPHASLVTADLNGLHSRRMNRRSVKLYFVLSGNIRIKSDGTEHEIGPLGAAMIDPGTWVELVGEAARIAILYSPAFNLDDEIIDE
ncbi:hypothetical protein OUY22_07765 [Nonomuraea sp. MCN248]|uniref:Cupin domain-containing protein n=1 Tax=Nonomuraea corallina TaxID=2989783 RepID=A0ABT4S7Z9_9ACTN|nr:hypothetical protein [Nonomuraea corallina]MDA0633314.1 hypothetical protein [Nonomuraea corallina]